MRRLVLITAALAAFTFGAQAEAPSVDPLAAAKIILKTVAETGKRCKNNAQDDKSRLACYDELVNKIIELSDNTESQDNNKTTNNTQTPDAPYIVNYKTVDAADLYVTTEKYLNRPIEVKNAKCFYADINEFRCIAGDSTALMITAANITPQAEKLALMDDCDSIKNVSSQKCRRTLRFTPLSHTEDTISGYQKRKIVMARSMEAIPPAASTGRRRR